MSRAPQTCTILSDSYLTKERIRGSILGNSVNIEPHRTSLGNTRVKVVNLAKGGSTFNKVLANEELLKAWVQSQPAVTLVHIGACDLVNKHIIVTQGKDSVGKTFCKILTDFLGSLNDIAKSELKERYQQWAEGHKFIYVQLPDWQNFQSKRRGSLSAEEYKLIRRKVNRYLKNCLGRIYGLHKALVVQPGISQAALNGVHFDKPSQKIYNKLVFNSVKRVLCEQCSPKQCWTTKKIIEQEFCTNNNCAKDSKE